MDKFTQYVQDNVTVAVKQVVRLGTTSFRLVSNVPDFPALLYFSYVALNPELDAEFEFELWCVSLEQAGIDREYLAQHVDRTYRGTSFSSGYYVTDHFGPSLYLVTRGPCYYVFGEQLEQIVWPYFVKYFLMLHSLKEGMLFLKAAALTIESTSTLIFGRGGAGKTVFLTKLCERGASFVTNSHALIRGNRLYGVASAMRIRPSGWSTGLVSMAESRPAIKPGELIIDPYRRFNQGTDFSGFVKNICVIDFRGAGCHTINTLTDQEAYSYAEQFALAINVYRLEEDVLDYYHNDYRQFAQAYIAMRAQLTELVKQSHCYYISSDMLESAYQDEVLALLS